MFMVHIPFKQGEMKMNVQNLCGSIDILVLGNKAESGPLGKSKAILEYETANMPNEEITGSQRLFPSQ